jgi:hypothetical protein
LPSLIQQFAGNKMRKQYLVADQDEERIGALVDCLIRIEIPIS